MTRGSNATSRDTSGRAGMAAGPNAYSGLPYRWLLRAAQRRWTVRSRSGVVACGPAAGGLARRAHRAVCAVERVDARE